METLCFFEYKGNRILDQDFTGADKTEIVRLLSQSCEAIEEAACQSLLVITNLEGVHFDVRASELFEYVAKRNRERVKRSAVYGASENIETALTFIGSMIQREFGVFDTRERSSGMACALNVQ